MREDADSVGFERVRRAAREDDEVAGVVEAFLNRAFRRPDAELRAGCGSVAFEFDDGDSSLTVAFPVEDGRVRREGCGGIDVAGGSVEVDGVVACDTLLAVLERTYHGRHVDDPVASAFGR